ncbi:MAG: hypothetical protein LBU55_01715 [Elusimicrobiota bacterium]|nr:hypothetical protein [Elusimicrobiota bacterium]
MKKFCSAILSSAYHLCGRKVRDGVVENRIFVEDYSKNNKIIYNKEGI